MNGPVKVTWIMLRTIAHSLMVHSRVSEAYINFALMYTTYHILPVLPIKDIINEGGNPTTPHKLEIGTKPSVLHLRMLFFPCVVRKSTRHVEKKVFKYASPSEKGFLRYLHWNPTASKRVSCVHTNYKEGNIFIRF